MKSANNSRELKNLYYSINYDGRKLKAGLQYFLYFSFSFHLAVSIVCTLFGAFELKF